MRTIPLIGKSATPYIHAAISAATRHIDVVTYLAHPATPTSSLAYRHLWACMLKAPARGITCRALIHAATPGSNHAAANQQSAATLTEAGWSVRLVQQSATIHAKIWLIDANLCVVGSHNLTDAAMSTNVEASILTDSHACAADIDILIANLWARTAPA